MIVYVNEAWNYAHIHWQDNVVASAIWAVPAYFWGRFHLKKIHRKLDSHTESLDLLHKKVNNG